MSRTPTIVISALFGASIVICALFGQLNIPVVMGCFALLCIITTVGIVSVYAIGVVIKNVIKRDIDSDTWIGILMLSCFGGSFVWSVLTGGITLASILIYTVANICIFFVIFLLKMTIESMVDAASEHVQKRFLLCRFDGQKRKE